jgi:hypothetical protein
MTFTVVSSRKCKITNLTNKRTFRGVSLHVRSQVVGTREDLVATVDRAWEMGGLDLFRFLDSWGTDAFPTLGSGGRGIGSGGGFGG